MSSIPSGPGIQQPAPVTGNGAASAAAPTGTLNGTPVTGVDHPDRQLGDIPPNQTSGRSIHGRSASQPANPPANQLSGSAGGTDKAETPKEKHKRVVEEGRQARENSTVEELEAEREALLEEAGEKYRMVEEHTVLGKALSALDNPSSAEKGVKVILQLPGEDKPIRLVPRDKKALKGRNEEELINLAKDLLKQYNNAAFSGFNKEEYNQRIPIIRDMLGDVVGKISEKDKSKSGSDWQKRLEDMQDRRSIIHVRQPAINEDPDGTVPELTVERLDDEKTIELLKDLRIIKPAPKTILQKIKWILDNGIHWK